MKKAIDIKNWKTGEVIFSYECEDNTIKKTVEEAVKQGINLSYADLKNTDLSNANLYESNLIFTDLSNANLSYSNLNFANINNTNLSNAVLYNTYLDCSDLSNAILDNVKGLNNQCPKTGSFIGWKKCYNKLCFYIVKLEIPDDAKRSSATTNKCRCSKAKVLEIQNLDGTKADVNEVGSWLYFTFKYKVGEIVEVSDFDERYWIECSRGIHFFMNYKDAVGF